MTNPTDQEPADPSQLKEDMKKLKEKFSTLTDGEHRKKIVKKEQLKKPPAKAGK